MRGLHVTRRYTGVRLGTGSTGLCLDWPNLVPDSCETCHYRYLRYSSRLGYPGELVFEYI